MEKLLSFFFHAYQHLIVKFSLPDEIADVIPSVILSDNFSILTFNNLFAIYTNYFDQSSICLLA